MRLSRAMVVSLLPVALLTGCDGIFSIDNWDPPNAILSGELLFNGEPVGLRMNGVTLQLWQVEPQYELEGDITVYVDQDGRYSAAVFDGVYEINLVSGNGPWVDDPTRRRVEVRGDTEFDIPVQPYYTIENETITYSPTPGPGGMVTATFQVGQHNTSRALEYVGVYVGTTLFVDRTNGLSIPNSVRERSRAAIADILEENGFVTIAVDLPEDIHLTPSPARRTHVFVRVGVKTVGVSEMLFSKVHKVEI